VSRGKERRGEAGSSAEAESEFFNFSWVGLKGGGKNLLPIENWRKHLSVQLALGEKKGSALQNSGKWEDCRPSSYKKENPSVLHTERSRGVRSEERRGEDTC